MDNLFTDKYQQQLPDTIDLVGPLGQIGICILRHVKTLKVKVNAIYRSNRFKDNSSFVCWTKLEGDKNLQPSQMSDCLIFTPMITNLPSFLLNHYLNPAVKVKLKLGRVVCFSSTSVFTKENSKNLAERKLIEQLQLAEEQVISICNQNKINWTIFRPTMIYGMMMDGNITRLMKFIDRYGFFIVSQNGRGMRMPVHADDLALAALAVLNLEKTYNKVYNLGGGEILSCYQLLEKIFDHFSRKKRIYNSNHCWPLLLDLISKLLKRNFNGEMARRMEKDLLFDYSEAKNDFGYSPRKLELVSYESH